MSAKSASGSTRVTHLAWIFWPARPASPAGRGGGLLQPDPCPARRVRNAGRGKGAGTARSPTQGAVPLDSAGQRDPEAVAGELTALGVDLVQVARQLEDKAVRLFQDSYAQLVDTVTAALSAAGADVHTDGTARPVGGG
jgi:hypothetical protein